MFICPLCEPDYELCEGDTPAFLRETHAGASGVGSTERSDATGRSWQNLSPRPPIRSSNLVQPLEQELYKEPGRRSYLRAPLGFLVHGIKLKARHS